MWKWELRNLFRAKGYIRHIDGTTAYDSDDEGRERDYNAYTLLTSSIERKFLPPLTSCNTAQEVWDR